MVGNVWELRALLGEESSVFLERFSRLLLAVAEVTRVARVDVSPFEISLKHCNTQNFISFKIDELNLNELFCEHFNIGK